MSARGCGCGARSWYDPAEPWHCSRRQVSADTELREGEEPDRIKSLAPGRRDFASNTTVLFRRRAKVTYRPFEAQCCSVTYAVDPIPHDARWYRIGQGVHAHRYEASPTDCRSRADTDQHQVSGDEDQLKRHLQLDA